MCNGNVVKLYWKSIIQNNTNNTKSPKKETSHPVSVKLLRKHLVLNDSSLVKKREKGIVNNWILDMMEPEATAK